jgi:5'-nucleotidase/UDP-sugar diphosphatase
LALSFLLRTVGPSRAGAGIYELSAVLDQMQRDLKIGLLLGLILVTAAALRLATHPSLSPKARVTHLHSDEAGTEPNEQPALPVIAGNPPPDPNAGQSDDVRTPSEGIDLKIGPTEPIDAIESEQSLTFDSTIYEQTEKIKTERFHIVRKNQTLSEIAYKYYGSARQWPKILEANRETIRDPKKLAPGTKIIIPD